MKDELYRAVKEKEDPKRFSHTLSVTRECERLSEIFVLDSECRKALITAAMLHDITKGFSEKEHIALANEYFAEISADDLASPAILHQITGALYVKKYLPEHYSAMLDSAISKHTTGDADMSLTDKLLCLADYIEEERNYEKCRQTREYFYSLIESTDKERALDLALLKYFENTVNHIKSKNLAVHPKTLKAYTALNTEIRKETDNV